MAELKEDVKNGTCFNKDDKNQSFTVLNCTVTCDNVSSPQVTAESNTVIDLTLIDSLQKDAEDGVILSECEKTNSSSIMSLKSNVTKHKLPFTATTVNSEGCSPCKISKVESQDNKTITNVSVLKCTITSNSLENERNLKENKIPFTSITVNPESSCKISKVESQGIETRGNVTFLNSTITSGNLKNERSYENKISQNETTARLENPQIYYQVLDMFPDVEHNDLIRLCNQESDLNQIINILLENDGYPSNDKFENQANDYPSDDGFENQAVHSDMNVQIITNSKSKPDEITYQDCEMTAQKESVSNKTNVQLEFLMQVLPDADRSFLESKSKLEENMLRDFIYEALETKKYPRLEVKVDEKFERSSNDEELGLFTTAFNIEKFLKIFPDPVQYFMDENRKCQYSGHAIEFLKRG